jgi:hypothetical protein
MPNFIKMDVRYGEYVKNKKREKETLLYRKREEIKRDKRCVVAERYWEESSLVSFLMMIRRHSRLLDPV